jgi:beta-lactamase regulating signal transducer with metallopeptidase domain
MVQSKRLKNSSHCIAASQHPIMPRTSIVPRKATFNKIKRILEDNEPAADVYVLATICLAYLSGFLALLCIMLIAIPQLLRRSKKSEVPQNVDDIELVAIKADDDADLVEALRRPTATVATLPRLSRTCEGNNSGNTTPPPLYAAHRADR